MIDLSGRTAIVTGASRGIGLAIAEALLAAGGRVVLTARTTDAAEQAAGALGDRVAAFGAHASDRHAAEDCVAFALERFGSLDVLVNNVGTNPAFGPLVEVEQGPFAKTLEVNLWAPLLWTQIAWRAWMRDHGGVVVNNASVGGLAVAPRLGAYNVSKAGLLHLTRQLALELAPRVRVNAVAPGIVRTRLSEGLWREHPDAVAAATPLARVGDPADVASAVVFLASDASAWVTGETIVIDGGQTLRLPAAEVGPVVA